MKRLAVLIGLLAVIAGLAFGQRKESLALLPFTGGAEGEGEYIVSEFARQRTLRNAFNRVTLVTSTTRGFMNFEQRFQRTSGLTDADTIFELGKQLNAAYVIAGYITKLGNQNLVMVSILSVESLQLVAGAYRAYRSIEEIDPLIPEMAEALAEALSKDMSRLPGLSVPPFEAKRGVNAADAQVLAQILAIQIANGEKYAVLPRTDSIEAVMEEHRRQRTGETDQERVKRLGAGRNAEYVLAGSVQQLGRLSKFTADILDIENGDYIDGYSEEYERFADGVEIMPVLAANINGGTAAPKRQGSGTVPEGMVLVPAGTYMMGSNNGDSDEKPVHQVTISKAYYMGKYEVTQAEWVKIMGHNPSNWKGDTLPVESVSWNEAVEYCNKRSLAEGLMPCYSSNGSTIYCNFSANGYRLPTEAEWEWAARGGGKDLLHYDYSGSNNVGTVAWYTDNSGGRTHPVGQKQGNSLGLYDMSGNVWEWCWDWYGGYSGSNQTDPAGAASGTSRVIRGGSWRYSAANVRSVGRDFNTPGYRYNFLGFRVARSF